MAEKTDNIICSICLNDFKQPKILDCKHSFCLICLEDYINKITTDNHFPCPLCRRDIIIPDGGVNEFEINYQLEAEDVSECDACKSGISSEFRCEDCQQYLCSTCKRCHANLTGTRNHVVVLYNKYSQKGNQDNPDQYNSSGDNPLPTETDFCSIHHDKIADYYCKPCTVGVCSRCFVENHNGHSFVDLLDETIRNEIKAELTTLKDSLETQITDFLNYSDSLKRTITDLNQSSKVSCRNVDRQVKKICSRIKKLGEDMKDKIHKSRQEELKKYTEKLEEMKILIEKLRVSVKCTENILADQSTVLWLNKIPLMKQEKQETSLQPLNLPIVTYTWFEEESICEDILLKQLGVLKNLDGPTFRSSFTVDEQEMLDTGINGYDYYIQGIPCCIRVERKKDDPSGDVYLGIYLCMDISEDSPIKSWKVKWSGKLVSRNGTHHIMDEGQNDEGSLYTSTDCNWGWEDFINWTIFADERKGFVDKDGIFSVQVTVKMIASVRSEN
ncbi:hypothetical protein SNE40_021640 [Patella caerulea]|uniref:Uncharacterized protein n=1 Tax=Patella caerulea TaxID=87958 RepID=A0AAN8G873_PATCE